MADSPLLSAERVNALYDECVDPVATPRIPRDGILTWVRFFRDRIEERREEIRELLTHLSEETRSGNSWRAFQFDQREHQWASSTTASKLIALGSVAGFVKRFTADEERALNVPLSESPWYRTTL